MLACFNVKTGDVEDAPAPDHLHKFDVFEKDGAVYIKGAEADVKAGRRKPTFKIKSAGQEKVVICGGYVEISCCSLTRTDTAIVVLARLVPSRNSESMASQEVLPSSRTKAFLSIEPNSRKH